MNVPNHEKKAFRDMTPEERSAIVQAKLRGEAERLSGDEWEDSDPNSINFNRAYRTRPRQLVIPWEAIKPRYKWAAMDENTNVWFFTEKPIAGVDIWVDGGDYCKSPLNIDTTGIDWRESLTARPEGV